MSKWKSGTVGDITGIGKSLEAIQTATDKATTAIDGLISAVDIIVQIIEVTKTFSVEAENIQDAAVNLAITQLETIVNSIIDDIDNLFKLGIFALPVYEAIDLPKAIRNEILNPEGLGNKSIEPVDGMIRVVDRDDPNRTHFERVLRYRQQSTDYGKFINDIINSFDDTEDPLRPQFESPVAGLTFAVSSDRVAIFLILMLLIDALVRDNKFGDTPQHSAGLSQAFVKILNIALGQAETLGVTHSEEQYNELRELRDTLLVQLGSGYKQSFKEWLDVLLEFKRDRDGSEEVTDYTFNGAKISSNSSAVNLIVTAPGSSGLTDKNTTGNPVPLNFTNIAYLDLDGSFKASVAVSFKDADPHIYQTTSNRIAIPLNAVAAATSADNTLVSPPTDIGELSLNPSTGNIEAKDTNGSPINTKFVPPTRVTVSLSDELDNVKDVFSFVLPRFVRYSNDTYPKPIGDGYRHDIFVEVDVDSTTKNEIAKNLGLSRKEVDRIFPLTSRTRELNLREYGDIDRIKLRLKVSPQEPLNSSFVPRLIVNGVEQTPDRVSLGTTTATIEYDTVLLGESTEDVFMFVSQVEKEISTGGTGDGSYVLYSEPTVFKIRSFTGKLPAPVITSGSSVNAARNAFEFNTELLTERALTTKDRFKTIYGDPRSGKRSLINGVEQEGDVGSKVTTSENKTAKYRLTGKKKGGTFAFAIVASATRSWLVELPDFISENRFAGNVFLDWDGDRTDYEISVYQTANEKAIEAIRNGITVEEFGRKFGFDSRAAVKTVTVDNLVTGTESFPPDWYAANLDVLFPIAEPTKQLFSEVLDAVRSSIPTSPYDTINDFLDITADKVGNISRILGTIKGVLENINSILQIGGTGFWVLALQADSIEDFKSKLREVEVPEELSNAKYVTGVQIIIPAGKVGQLFPNLFGGGLADSISDDIVDDIKNSTENIKSAAKQIKELATEDLKEVNFRLEDID